MVSSNFTVACTFKVSAVLAVTDLLMQIYDEHVLATRVLAIYCVLAYDRCAGASL